MKKIAAFDSLRFIASIFVILHHTGINLYEHRNLPNPYFRATGLAVEIFFVLSGFLLAASYYKSVLKNEADAQSCRRYFYNRIKRLYPEYIFAMLLCALLTNLFSHHISMRTFMLNAAMLAGWGNIPNIINGIWYVVVLFWGGCFLFNLLTLWKEKAIYIIIPTLSCVCLFYLVNHGQTISGHQYGIEFNLFSKGTIRGILGLTVGIYCYQVCSFLKECSIKLKPGIQSFALFVGEAVSVCLLVNAILVRKSQNISDFNIYFYISYIIGLLYFGNEKILKFLSLNIFKRFNYLSYTIYLTHLILLEILRDQWGGSLSTTNAFFMYCIVIVLSIAFGYICYNAQKWLFKKLSSLLAISGGGGGAINSCISAWRRACFTKLCF